VVVDDDLVVAVVTEVAVPDDEKTEAADTDGDDTDFVTNAAAVDENERAAVVRRIFSCRTNIVKRRKETSREWQVLGVRDFIQK